MSDGDFVKNIKTVINKEVDEKLSQHFHILECVIMQVNQAKKTVLVSLTYKSSPEQLVNNLLNIEVPVLSSKFLQPNISVGDKGLLLVLDYDEDNIPNKGLNHSFFLPTFTQEKILDEHVHIDGRNGKVMIKSNMGVEITSTGSVKINGNLEILP